MADIVNLRTVRKRKARAGKERLAEENRVRHGLPARDRLAVQAVRDRMTATHEAHRRERPTEKPEDGDNP